MWQAATKEKRLIIQKEDKLLCKSLCSICPTYHVVSLVSLNVGSPVFSVLQVFLESREILLCVFAFDTHTHTH